MNELFRSHALSIRCLYSYVAAKTTHHAALCRNAPHPMQCDRTFRARVRLSGSRDETVRVWSVTDGRPITLFDVHAAVCDVIMTSDAGRIVVRLADSCNVPFLCLHNSPASTTVSGRRHSHTEPPVVGITGLFILAQII